jgi:TonB-linked SusC/RagA family outer membrane protein
MKKNKIIISALLACISLPGYAQEANSSTSGKQESYADRVVHVGYNTARRLEESTASTSTIYSEDFNKRAAKNVGNSIFGHGLGLTVLQGSGTYTNREATFYIRGQQSLSGSTPLVLVDGIERDLSFVVPEEVESVTVLKDAAAVAIYGYKGINGVLNIVSKRGKSNSREVKISYDHTFDSQVRRPEFVDAYTYAGAMNEALANDGLPVRYSADELNAFRSGTYPFLYPDVNWIDGTFKDKGGVSDIYNISFRGGGESFRYFAMANLTNNSGFIAHPDMNDGYSTQDMYSKANLRTNLDVDLTPDTKLRFNLSGTLRESRAPGANTTDYTGADLWDMIYTLPAAAYPAQLEDGKWGGNAIWPGTGNPIAMSQAAAYSKSHDWSIFADMTLSQDLSAVLPGLGATALLAYDNISNVWENHSKTFIYGSDAVTGWANGAPTTLQRYTGGTETGLETSSSVTGWNRVFNTAVSLNYDRTFDLHGLYSQLKWDYEYRNRKGLNRTWYRQNVSLYTHYGYKGRYFADLTLVTSGSNKLAPGSKWAFSPTISAAWILSKEEFMENITPRIDFLKLRASFGIINTDRLPLVDDTEQEGYWEQVYSGGAYYPFDAGYSVSTSSWTLGRLASLSSKHEKARKSNLGLDATLFKSLDLTLEGYYQRRSDIWLSSGGKYSSVLGFTAPFENGGIVDSWGTEVGANYTKTAGNAVLNAGVNFTFAKSKIIEMMEEPRLYPNLEQTGNPLNTVYGLQAIGFFKDPADIDASPKQMFGDVKPGDIKYKDVNQDNQIDENDKCAIGYSNVAPEIYYSFHLGAEWKGLGFDFLFQGTGRYSAVLNTKSLYWPLINNTTISRHYYDNRWTEGNRDAKYPRLTSQSNENNFQTNTVWLEDRSFLKLRTAELYYRFPQSLMDKTKYMKGVKLYLRGVDLFCFDNIKIADPEAYGVTSPLTKSIIAGLTVQF